MNDTKGANADPHTNYDDADYRYQIALLALHESNASHNKIVSEYKEAQRRRWDAWQRLMRS